MKRSVNTSYGRLRKPSRVAKRTRMAAPTIRKYVAKAIKGTLEKKYLDTKISRSAISNNVGNFLVLNNVPYGTDWNQRVGRHIKLSHLVIKAWGRVYTSSTGFARWWVVYDKQSNGLIPSVSDLFEPDTLNDDGSIATTSQRNISTWADRFKILKTGLITPNVHVNPQSSLTGDKLPSPDGETCYAFVDVYINLKDVDTEFYNTSSEASTTTVSSGALYFVCTTHTVEVPGGSPGQGTPYTGSARLCYTDA